MFYVAVGDNWCYAAPKSWVDQSKNTCRWPLQHVSRAILEQHEPDESWEWHQLKYILGPYQSYKTAKDVEIKAQFLASDDSHMPHIKIKEEKASDDDYKYEECKTDYDDEPNYVYADEDQQTHKKLVAPQPSKRQFPYPPSNSRKNRNRVSLPSGVLKLGGGNSDDQLQNILITPSTEYQEYNALEPMTIISESSQTPIETLNRMTQPRSFQKQPNPLELGASSQHGIQPTSAPDSTGSDIAAILRSIDSKLELILRCLNCQELTPNVEITTDQLPAFPLATIEEFEKFCKDLEMNSELRTQFKRKIIKIGGTSGEVHLTNTLVATVTNGLGKQLTWEGQRETHGIKNTLYANIILWTILQRHAMATSDGLSKCFREWLRRSGDRYRYHLKFGRET